MKLKDKWKRGLPYVGNKGQKAQQIIDLLPAGGRFIDCFGGGGSISLHAWDSGKYKEVVYNEQRASVVELLQMLLNNNPQIDLNKYVYLTREQFFDWRDNQPDSWERTLVLTAWSFSNNLKGYLWGKKVAPDKLLLTRALLFGDTGTQFDEMYENSKNLTTIAEKYTCFHKWRREKMNVSSRYDQLLQLERLQQLERLEQSKRLQQASTPSVSFITGDYRDLAIKNNDVVYCDPPYIDTSINYGGFDFDSFHDWYTSQPTDVYISEYTQLPDTEVYAELGKKHSMTATGKRRKELLLRVVK